MKPIIFNTCLALGWVLIVLGVSLLHSVAAALLVGGMLLVGVTLLLARWAGVLAKQSKDPGHVSQ